LEANISEALSVLVVGMTTVFLILSLVVISGTILIRLLNRFGLVLNEEDNVQSIPESAIAKAIHQWSNGRAKVVSAKKKD